MIPLLPLMVGGGAMGGIGLGTATMAASALQAYEGRRSAERQMDFQADQAATQHQRGVQDMIAAGLNPALMYSGGGGSAPSMQGSQTPIPDLAHGVSSALAARKLHSELKLLDSQRVLNAASASAQLSSAELNANSAQAVGATLPGARNRAAVERTKLGKFGAFLDRIMHSVSGVTGAFRGTPVMPFSSESHRIFGR